MKMKGDKKDKTGKERGKGKIRKGQKKYHSHTEVDASLGEKRGVKSALKKNPK